MIAKQAVGRILTLVAAAGFMACAAAAGPFDSLFGSKEEAPPPPPWEKTDTGAIVKPAEGQAKAVRLMVMSDGIVRVTVSPDGAFDYPDSLMVRAKPEASAKFDVTADNGVVTLKTAKVVAKVSLKDGAVRFFDGNGKEVLTGAGAGSFAPVKIDGQDFYAVRAEFNRGSDEGLYGFGQHQNRQMNLNGEDVILAQHNMDVAIPMIVSTRNYGILWDNYSITRLGWPHDYKTLSAELTLRDADGNTGGLTARYYDGDKLLTTRVENDPNYQFINDTPNFPPEVANPKGVKVPFGEPVPTSKNLKVVYEGSLETQKTGVHKFRFYVSAYFKLWIDDKLVMDSWRQGWQGWYRNIEIPMVAGKKVKFRAEWRNEGTAYLRFLHLDPLPDAERHELSLSSEVARAIDYYYIAGDDMDGVVAGYRHLTGKAPIMPKWSYGFWQSRQRYETQDQLVSVVKKYRQLKLPLDVIVQDWRYWKDPEWGTHDFDETRFPAPQKMFDDVHDMNAKLMIVIWPKFYEGLKHFKEFDSKGLMYRYSIDKGYIDWVGPGYVSSNYDTYSKEARDIYWRQVRDKLDVLGPDAWWMDNDEPDIHSNLNMDDQVRMRGPTVAGPGALLYNSYPLVHVCGFYDHWQAAHPDKRAFILTRSAYGGVQRCSAAVWSGDIAARWSDMHDQVAAGVNFSLAGVPNWTFDIGGFSTEARYNKVPMAPADSAEWKELYTRWFQFGAFVPVFRSHGEFPLREIYETAKPGSEVFNILAMYDRLRYRLMPYIYTTAAATYHQDGTIMRGLVMDFAADKKVWNIDDEFMLGHAFLVAPVMEYKARSREVYLPAGADWYDLYTGKHYAGGQTIVAPAPLKYMPVFVRAGAIVPTGPKSEYVDQYPEAPITFVVYTGKNGSFSLYEDDGKTNAYSRGRFTTIPVAYDDATGTVTIGARQGEFAGMLKSRTFKVRFVSGTSPDAFNFDAKAIAVTYDGTPITVTRK